MIFLCRDRRKLSEDDLDLYSLGEGHPDLSISELRGIDQELSDSLNAIFVTPLPEIVSNDLRKAVLCSFFYENIGLFYWLFLGFFVNAVLMASGIYDRVL